MGLYQVEKCVDCQLSGGAKTFVVECTAFLWSFFQLFIASPIPFWLASSYGVTWVVLTGLKVRVLHLSFALFLLFLLIPAVRQEGRKWASGLGWCFSLAAVASVMYVFVFYDGLAVRMAMPSTLDVVAAVLGVLFLLEAARRAIGFPIVVVASVFLLYSYFGQYMPDLIAHKGHDIASIVSHEWLSSEGVFGVALGVSCNFVFLYVLFGALLDKAGAGSFFMRLSFTLLRGFVGGPAKAAVVASGFMGMMSGSSVANTITIGSFTIPLMKKMGMSPEKAAAIEVSAGINGQIMPPVMGAAAFLMSEFLSIPYSSIVKYAFVPALMVYAGLLFIVHLEACRLNVAGEFVRRSMAPGALFKFLIFACSSILLLGTVYFVIEGVDIGMAHVAGIKDIFSEDTFYVVAFVLASTYVVILLRQSPRSEGGENASVDDEALGGWEIFKQGMHYFLPVFILVWSLVVERLSSSLACFWTNMFLVFMLLSGDVVSALREGNIAGVFPALLCGVKKVYEAMVASSKNMLPVAVATGTAGIIVGTVGLTGFGLTIGSFVDALAGGSLFVALIVTAAICVVLGMGMPTTGCYIIVSTLMVPVLSAVVHQNGLSVPLVALHLFVFYFGLMADVTPPVGIASYAAAAIAHANSFKTGVQSFLYNIKTMIVPFLFVFDSDIILYDVKNMWVAALKIFLSLLSILSISAGMQGYLLRKNRFYESVALIAVGVVLVMPNYLVELFIGKYVEVPLVELNRQIALDKRGAVFVLFEHESRKMHVTVPVGRFDGTVLQVLQENLGLKVDTSGVRSGRGVSILGVREGSYVASEASVGDRIVKLALSRRGGHAVYLYVVALALLAVLLCVQIYGRKAMEK